MARKKAREKLISEQVIPESPESLEASVGDVAAEEITVETPAATEAKVKEDPRYVLLKDSLKHLMNASPAFEKVKANPWLYLEWRTQLERLVQ